MSLETELEKNTAALVALTAALKDNKLVQNEPAQTPTKAIVEAPRQAPAEDSSAPVTKKELVAAVIELAKEKGRETAAALLAEYGASKVPELTDESKYPEIVAKIETILQS